MEDINNSEKSIQKLIHRSCSKIGIQKCILQKLHKTGNISLGMKRRQSLGSSDDSLKKSLGCSLALNHRLYGGNIISKFIKECFIHHCQYVSLQLLNINLKFVEDY